MPPSFSGSCDLRSDTRVTDPPRVVRASASSCVQAEAELGSDRNLEPSLATTLG